VKATTTLASSGRLFPAFVPSIAKFAIAYNIQGTGLYAVLYNVNNLSTNATANNFIGFSAGSYSNGQTATIKFKGSKVDGLSSLTPASKYYLQYDGTLATTADAILGSVYAGQAISSTSLIMN
jgi:hypothetical protein